MGRFNHEVQLSRGTYLCDVSDDQFLITRVENTTRFTFFPYSIEDFEKFRLIFGEVSDLKIFHRFFFGQNAKGVCVIKFRRLSRQTS